MESQSQKPNITASRSPIFTSRRHFQYYQRAAVARIALIYTAALVAHQKQQQRLIPYRSSMATETNTMSSISTSTVLGKRKQDSLRDVHFEVRVAFQGRVATAPFFILSLDATTDEQFYGAILEKLPVVANKVLSGESVSNTVYLLQERVLPQIRWVTVGELDVKGFTLWYARNVDNGKAETLKIEVHVLTGGNDDQAAVSELNEVGRARAQGAKWPLRQGTGAFKRITISGQREFHQVALKDIDEDTIRRCSTAARYLQAPSTGDWFPRRRVVHPHHAKSRNRKKKRRPRRKGQKRARTTNTEDESNSRLGVEDGGYAGSDDGEESSEDENLPNPNEGPAIDGNGAVWGSRVDVGEERSLG